MDTTMETMILLVGQFCSSLFLWIGIALLAERATISAFQKRFIQIFGALLFLVWFAAIPLLAQRGFFRGVGIPLALVLTLIFGFFLMFSQTFRKLLTITPMHWCLRYEPGYPSHLEKLAKHRTHQTANCYDPAENSCKNVTVLLTLATRTVSCRGDDIES